MDSNQLLLPNDKAMSRLGGIGRTMLYDLIAAGELEQVHIGRRSFITARSIAAYVDRLASAS